RQRGRDEPRLLLQLPPRADLPVLALEVRPPGRHLVEIPAARVAVLAEEEDLGVNVATRPEEREDGGRARVADDLQVAAAPVREAHGVHGEVDDGAVVDGEGGETLWRTLGAADFLAHSTSVAGTTRTSARPSAST